MRTSLSSVMPLGSKIMLTNLATYASSGTPYWSPRLMAIANEVLRAKLGFDAWLTVKTWGVTVASIAFGMAQLPMLLRHGLTLDDAKAEPPLPPEG